MKEAAPARVQVLLASDSPQGVLIRRGPSKETGIIGWNRLSDTFQVGQWLKGKVYSERCDIAPDGKHWIYFTMSAKGKTWTAVAKTPYLKALDFYKTGDTWGGGGIFLSNQSYWHHEGIYSAEESRQESGFAVVTEYPEWNLYRGIQFARMVRDGWSRKVLTKTEKENYYEIFERRINEHWSLCCHFSRSAKLGYGASSTYYSLRNSKTDECQECPEWEWADIDGGRIVWTEKGRLMAGKVRKTGLSGKRMLMDTNLFVFERLVAPY